MNDKFRTSYAYAKQRNGFVGSYEDYVRALYRGYVNVCESLGIKPKTFEQWDSDV